MGGGAGGEAREGEQRRGGAVGSLAAVHRDRILSLSRAICIPFARSFIKAGRTARRAANRESIRGRMQHREYRAERFPRASENSLICPRCARIRAMPGLIAAI